MKSSGNLTPMALTPRFDSGIGRPEPTRRREMREAPRLAQRAKGR